MRDIVRYVCRPCIRLAPRSAMSPIALISFLSVYMTFWASLGPGDRLLRLKLLECLGHGGELGSDGGEGLGGEESLPEREAARIADSALEVARPHMLDKQEACGGA